MVPGHKVEGDGAPQIAHQNGDAGTGPTVLVIDRQPLFVAALGTLLTSPPVNARLRFARDCDAGMHIIEQGGVDLVFCELRAEPVSALQLAERLNTLTPKVPVIVLGDSDDELLGAAMQSSIAGLFTKDAALDEFLVGVNAVLAGHRAVGAKLMSRLLTQLADQSPAARRNQMHLSATELDILKMIGQAQSVQAIAASRGISTRPFATTWPTSTASWTCAAAPRRCFSQLEWASPPAKRLG